MAPPRQRTAAAGTATVIGTGTGTGTAADDSRSEASSGHGHGHGHAPREKTSKSNTTTTTARKAIPGFRADNRTAAGSGQHVNVTSAPQEVPNIPWSDMPLDILHAYRHAYNLPVASAFSGTYSRVLLSQGIGLRSPTSIAAQRAQAQAQARGQGQRQRQRENQRNGNGTDGNHKIIGQNRVGKEHLALAVRRHFNSAGLAEQETIARFLYKVREEGKGRQFRLRFQP